MSERLLRLLREDAAVVVLTGAGISAESGVPTFRGKDGLWNKFDPRELACIDAFMANPQLVWEWYMFRRRLVREAQPNAGHRTLVEMQRQLGNLTLITQNVDNLHQLAGSQNVIELHGNIMRNKCFDCGAPMELAEIDPENIPLCECGGKIRLMWSGSARCCLLTPSTVLFRRQRKRICSFQSALLLRSIRPQIYRLSPNATVDMWWRSIPRARP